MLGKLSLHFNTVHPLKYSTNILTYPLNTCSLGGALHQKNCFFFFFNMDTTKEEDVGEENRTVVCQGAAVIRRGWKRKKRYLTLFNDILVVSSKL